ncbi:unknown [[Mannheimia] succiniciproducens MBEL55E]|uniref:Lipoprotein n=1 Tax=Mannheimia succiniciproducens (strain KCTC 0769BP / MBEL55E) TaxID=221988 RepID=Q65SB2_MANSM|nr:unknown [[Mannheimia] succiniciproducens MBEL55E]
MREAKSAILFFTGLISNIFLFLSCQNKPQL